VSLQLFDPPLQAYQLVWNHSIALADEEKLHVLLLPADEDIKKVRV